VARDLRTMARGHAVALMPMVVAVMAGRPFGTLDAIAVTVGPGSFTGIRVGLAAARGIGLAAARPVLGLTTFEAIACGIGSAAAAGRPVLVALETGRSDLYLQLFANDLRPLRAPVALPLDEAVGYAGAGPLLLAGDGAARVRVVFSDREVALAPGPGWPDAAEVARAAAERLGALGPPTVPPKAFYLRAADTTGPRLGS